jgi:hypothetical protein
MRSYHAVSPWLPEKVEAIAMNSQKTFCDSDYGADMDIAEHELFAFIAAVNQLFGPEEAKVSAEDWLDESELMDSPPQFASRNWRAVTIAASAKLANRMSVARQRRSQRQVGIRTRHFFTREFGGGASGMKLLGEGQ